MIVRLTPAARRVSTAYLLTCAAIGVAGGILLWGVGALSTLLFAVAPPLSVSLAGLWLLPAVVALRLLERPLAGVLVGLLAGLVVFPFLGASLMWSSFAELPFLVLLYRRWTTWQHLAGAAFAGVVYPILAAVSYDLWSFAPWAVAGFFALTIASCLAATWIGIAIGDALRHAGVARLARRRPQAPTG